MKRQMLWTLAWVLLCLPDVGAQNFLGGNPGLPPVHGRALAWTDFDNDGDQDLMVAGTNGAGARSSYLLRNDGATTFVALTLPVPGLDDAAAAWSDLDGDGDQDLVVSGSLSPVLAHLAWYRNDSAGVFVAQALPINGLLSGSIAIGDLDGDLDPDLMVTGWNPQRLETTAVIRNNGGGNFSLAWDTQHPGLSSTVSDIGDYDGDGDLDVVLSGINAEVRPQTFVLRNEGGLLFYRKEYDLPQLMQGSVQWADYDLDGDLDLFTTGAAPDKLGRLYAYAPDGFQATADVFPSLAYGGAFWGNIDPNADNLPDLILSGESNLGHLSWAYRNGGSGFTLVQPVADIIGLIESHVAWADWSGDGYTDFVISGLDAARLPITKLYRYNPSLQIFVP